MALFRRDKKIRESTDPESDFRTAETHAESGDLGQALVWYQKAAAGGHPESIYNVGIFHAQQGEMTEAKKIWARALDAKFLAAAIRLAQLALQDGSYVEAAAWIDRLYQDRALDEEYCKSLAEIGMHAETKGRHDEAFQLFHRIVDTGVHATGMNNGAFRIAMLHKARGEIDPAILWGEMAAEAGVRDAMFNVGGWYWDQGNVAKAVHWHTKAADAGDHDAMCWLADWHRKNGEDDLAHTWYTKAADAGNVRARTLLELTSDKLFEVQVGQMLTGSLLVGLDHDERTDEVMGGLQKLQADGNNVAAWALELVEHARKQSRGEEAPIGRLDLDPQQILRYSAATPILISMLAAPQDSRALSVLARELGRHAEADVDGSAATYEEALRMLNSALVLGQAAAEANQHFGI